MWTLILTLVIFNNSERVTISQAPPVSTFAQVVELDVTFHDELDCNDAGKLWVKSVSDSRVKRYYSCIRQSY